MKFVRHGIHQFCPGVVNSLGTPRRRLGVSGTTVSQRGKMTYKPGEPAGKTGDSILSVGKKSKMPHEMLLRDSESTVHRIKILM